MKIITALFLIGLISGCSTLHIYNDPERAIEFHITIEIEAEDDSNQ